MTAAQWNRRHDAIKRHARLDGDDRRAHGAVSERMRWPDNEKRD
nr:hypothetical protein [Burkholderia ubonensis]